MYNESVYPKVIYRYRSLAGGGKRDIASCKEDYLWFSGKSDFNDPYEFIISEKIVMPSVEQLHRAKMKNELIYSLFVDSEMYAAVESQDEAEFKNACNKNFLPSWKCEKEKLIADTKCCCFSDIPDNYKMWTHYADALKGVAFGYSTGILLSHLDRESIYPVKYLPEDSSFPEVVVSDYLFDGQENFVRNFFEKTFCTKSNHWKSEREWRIVTQLEGNKYYYPKGSLVEVVFGERTEEKYREAIRSALHDDVVYKEAVCSSEGYRIDVRDLEF